MQIKLAKNNSVLTYPASQGREESSKSFSIGFVTCTAAHASSRA